MSKSRRLGRNGREVQDRGGLLFYGRASFISPKGRMEISFKSWQCFRPYSKFRKADLSEDSYLNKCRLKRWKAEAPSIGVSLGKLNGCSEV